MTRDVSLGLAGALVAVVAVLAALLARGVSLMVASAVGTAAANENPPLFVGACAIHLADR